MNVDKNDWKAVPLPDRVQVSVAELERLREDAALLAALMQSGVERWEGYAYAQWLRRNDPDIKAIRLGEADRS